MLAYTEGLIRYETVAGFDLAFTDFPIKSSYKELTEKCIELAMPGYALDCYKFVVPKTNATIEIHNLSFITGGVECRKKVWHLLWALRGMQVPIGLDLTPCEMIEKLLS